MSRKHSISFIIIAMNEADRIRPCLESIAGLADQIVVLDSGSTDDTAAICHEYTDEVHVTPDWPGFGIQKQRALDRATGEWVFRIDADERLSDELRAEIEDVLDRDTIEETAFSVAWATWFFGKYLRYGDAADRHLNLFRRDGARFATTGVHAKILPAAGPTGRLRGRLLHVSHRNLRHFLAKSHDYAWSVANDQADSGRRASPATAYRHAWGRFFKAFLLRRGFLDGWRGLLLASLHGHYAFNKYVALWSLSHPAYPPDESGANGPTVGN